MLQNENNIIDKILFCWTRIIYKECEFLFSCKRLQRNFGEVSGPQIILQINSLPIYYAVNLWKSL